MKVVATVHVSGENGIASGEGAIWTLNSGDGSVSRIDARTNMVVARIPIGAMGSSGMAVGLGSVWVSGDTLPLAQIDPHTNKVVAQYTTDFGANTVAVGLGSLWLPSPTFDAMWRLRPSPWARLPSVRETARGSAKAGAEVVGGILQDVFCAAKDVLFADRPGGGFIGFVCTVTET